MADAKVTVAPAPTPPGPDIDNTTETTGAGVVYRQRVSVAGVGGNNQLAIDGSGNIGVSNFPATQPVSGTLTVIQGTGTNLHVVVDSAPSTAVTNAGLTNLDVALSTRLKPADTLTGVTTVGTVSAVTAITNALPAGSNVIGHVIADTGSTTAVTGNVAVTNAGLTNLDVALSTRTKPADQQHAIVDSGTLTAVTSITNPVAVTGTFFQASQPVTEVNLDAAIVAADGSTDPTKLVVIAGESNDATAMYGPMPLGASARSVIVEGFTGGTGVSVSGFDGSTNRVLSIDGSGVVNVNVDELLLIEIRAMRYGMERLLDQYGIGMDLVEASN